MNEAADRPIRVLLVDDQPLMLGAFRMALRPEPDIEVVGEATDGAEAIEEARRHRPDVVLMDIRMPGMDGVQATQALSQELDWIRVLILTTFDLDEYIVDALRAGASGFLLKDVRPEDLADAVRVVARGDALLAPSVTRRLLDRFVGSLTPAPTSDGALGSLTERELEVLTLIGRGLSNGEISAALFVEDTTVRTHVRHILEKLRLRDRVQAVVLAYDTGLVRPSARLTNVVPGDDPDRRRG